MGGKAKHFQNLTEMRLYPRKSALPAQPPRNGLSARRRFLILRRDNFRCQLCGASPDDGSTALHVDHRLAVARGGTSDEANLWTLCADCNLGKGAEGLC
jgi:5-methylcytosine-specific restriction endonuclease McrA